MIKDFVSAIAAQMGMNRLEVSLVDGHHLGCVDFHLLNVSSKGHDVSALLFQSDLENLNSGVESERLKVQVSASLSRLQTLTSRDNFQVISNCSNGEKHPHIKKFVTDLAAQMDINLSQITLIDGETLGCHDAHLLHMYSDGFSVNALVFRVDLENTMERSICSRLEVRIRASLSRLQLMLEEGNRQ